MTTFQTDHEGAIIIVRSTQVRDQELMGHKRIDMTLRYAHLAPGHKRTAIAVLEKSPSKIHNITENQRRVVVVSR